MSLKIYEENDIINIANAIRNKIKFSLLPSDYQEVEYIETTGSQYIDLGFKGNQDFKINLDTIVSYPGMLFGDITTSGTAISLNFNTNAGGSVNRFGSRSVNDICSSLSYGVKYNIEYSRYGLLVDGNSLYEYESISDFETTANMSLLKAIGSSKIPKLKLYTCKIYNADNLIRDFIPCYRKEDNVAGLYDIINSQFYINSGSGTFIVGENKEKPTKTTFKVSEMAEYINNIKGE